MFIGDKIDGDYRGAEKTGITPILVQRTVSEAGEDSGLRIISSLGEIFQFM